MKHGLRYKARTSVRSPPSAIHILYWTQSLKILLSARYNSIHLTPYLRLSELWLIVSRVDRALIDTPAVWCGVVLMELDKTS